MKCIFKILSICVIVFSTINLAFSNSTGLMITAMDLPIPVDTKDKKLLVYEIHIVNPEEKPSRINLIEVRDEKNKLLKVSDGVRLVNDSIVYKNKKIFTNNPIELQKNMSVIIYMWIELDKNEPLPSKLINTIWSVTTNDDKSQAFIDKLAYVVPIHYQKLPILSAPLKGENWVAVNTMDNNANHRRTFSLHNGKPYLDQRYAIDFEQIGSDGRESHGDMHTLQNWNAYGHKILAVADGVIVNMRNAITKDNIPPNAPNPKPSEEDIPGNFVVLKVKQNNKNYFVFYGHMQPNSITVRIGDKVKTGQVLGLLGNTGNSGVPHLHMHVMDGEKPMASNGLPFVFNDFQWQGKANVIDLDYGLFLPDFFKAKYQLQNTIPTNNDILKFNN